jgi:hypothetical protein
MPINGPELAKPHHIMIRLKFYINTIVLNAVLGLCVFLFSAASLAFKDSPTCAELFRSRSAKDSYRMVHGEVELDKLENFFRYRDITNKFVFEAVLRRGGLSMEVYLASHKRQTRSARRGSELYTEMMAHFGVEKIDYVEGTWLGGFNSDQFYEGLARGMSLEQAALNTWSGRQAQRFGFNTIESIFFDKETYGPEGRHGVQVKFVRSSVRQ